MIFSSITIAHTLQATTLFSPTMADIIREAPLGQLIRYFTRNKFLKYPEEEEGFEIPWLSTNVEKSEKTDPLAKEVQVDAASSIRSNHTDNDPELGQITLTRTITRDSTRQWTEERRQAEEEEAIERTQSNVIVPTKTADGITLVDWYTTDDPANPQNWSLGKKIYITALILLYTFAVYVSSSIYTTAQGQVMAQWNLNYAQGSTILSLYVLGYGLGPLLFSPLSEIPAYGRNIWYITTFFLFTILGIPTALVDNYAGLLVLRFLTGFLGSPALATSGASLQDIYSLIKLPYAIAVWAAAAFCGPALGPVLSGYATQAKGWRWAFWEIVWIAGPVFVAWFISMPETSSGTILLRRARRLRKLTGNDKLLSQSEIDQGTKKFSTVTYEALIVPLLMTVQDPAILFAHVYTALIYGVYYSFFEAFPLVYIDIYHFNIGSLGVAFLCMTVACVLGLITYCSYVYFYLEPDIMKNGMRAQEHRLVPALIAVWALPISMFWFGWTAKEDIHWMSSIAAITLFAWGGFVL